MLTTTLHKVPTAFMAIAFAVSFVPSAMADQMIDPDQLPPKAREFALRGPLGARDPFGNPANAGCNWSRVQVPSSQGLKWMAVEECVLNFNR
jgi:hypothetical protein